MTSSCFFLLHSFGDRFNINLMSNSTCPADSCRPAPSTGVCVLCGHVTCDGCERAIPAADAHRVQWVPGEWAPTALCGACLEEDSDGVPEEVDSEPSGAQTVRLATPATGELAAEWIDRLYSQEAA